MSDKIFIFEDDKYFNFYPLTFNRPVYQLLSGISLQREKIGSLYPDTEINLLCRQYLAPVLQEKTGLAANRFDFKPFDRHLFLNGRVRCLPELPTKINFDRENVVYTSRGEVVAFCVDDESRKKLSPQITKLHKSENLEVLKGELEQIEVEFALFSYLWELVTENPDMLRQEMGEKLSETLIGGKLDPRAILMDENPIFIGKDAIVDGGVVLDSRQGPIYIEPGAQVGNLTCLEGPAYIGRGSRLAGGRITGGCSFGPQCRIGGEVQNTIVLGYSNKWHHGFLGHSYLGEWVNLGALTTNSDLKNNYSSVRVDFGEKTVDSGQIKVGSFIGDHVKTGIGTLLNTGAIIGFASNIFAGGLVERKYVPPFSWGDGKSFVRYEIEKFIANAKVVMSRREKELSEDEAKLFRLLAEKQTANSRQ
jgi:UDP-N-acetylglucosamine diphosphorylase/glucosamine-1-phosphate N-acetyltransferase